MKKKILHFYLGYSSFVRKDEDILRKRYPVVGFKFSSSPKWLTPWRIVQQFSFILRHVWNTGLMVCQSAGYLSFLPVLLGKMFRIPVLIIVIGTDAHSFPSIHYGHFRKPALAWFTRFSLKHATVLAPVHGSLVDSVYEYDDRDFPRQGFLYFAPDVRTPVRVILNGYDDRLFRPLPGIRRETTSFVTAVANIDIPDVYFRKGIDLYLEMARRFPDYRFVLLGVPPDHPMGKDLSNLEKIPFVPQEKLAEVYSRCRFYLQLSMAEGLPNAICEAMLCECVPIASAVFALPEIVGDSGFLLPRRDPDLLEALIRKALHSDLDRLGRRARARIQTLFPLKRREEELLQLVAALMEGIFPGRPAKADSTTA
ncbi:MAG: glycosyltransferase [Calditrichaeota bacterium]|nr:MAG: glycosyltransferase [Calditrichota bacterium]